MRQLSKRTQYSLRALYALTRTYGAGPQLITNLAARATALRERNALSQVR
jgi:DNA-binding IscR family transcriptional regulator